MVVYAPGEPYYIFKSWCLVELQHCGQQRWKLLVQKWKQLLTQMLTPESTEVNTAANTDKTAGQLLSLCWWLSLKMPQKKATSRDNHCYTSI